MKEQNLCKKAKLIIFFKKFFPGTTLSEGGTNLPFRGGFQEKDKNIHIYCTWKNRKPGNDAVYSKSPWTKCSTIQKIFWNFIPNVSECLNFFKIAPTRTLTHTYWNLNERTQDADILVLVLVLVLCFFITLVWTVVVISKTLTFLFRLEIQGASLPSF